MPITMLKALWNYRGFILGNVKREFQSKYRNSLLGAAWNVLNPLSMIIVYTVIFSQVMKTRLPGVDNTFAYSIYLCSGVLTWGLFAELVSRGQNVFIDNANLLKKINFPRLCLPVIVVFNALLNFAIVFSLFTIFLIVSGNFPGIVYFSIFPVLLILIMFSIGFGIAIGVLNVFFRDIGQFFGILIQFWFWFTPIIYSVSILPDGVREYINYNPMAGVVAACQTILVKGEYPVWSELLPVTVAGVVLCCVGMRLFRKHAGEMVDEL